MATSTWWSVLNHTSDAAFRAWGSELSANLASIGLVQTSDTGQINWSTVTRASASSTAGYEMWRFNDSLQSSSPVYIKLLYGTNATANARLGFQVGNSTDGAGNFNEQNTVISYVGSSSYNMDQTTQQTIARKSMLSYSDNYGFFGLVHKVSAYDASYGSTGVLLISRTNDISGIPTANGVSIYSTAGDYNINSGGMRYSYIRNITSKQNNYVGVYNTVASSWSGCVVPWNGSLISGTTAVAGFPTPRTFLHWSTTPEILPMIQTCTVNNSEISPFSIFNTTLFGSTAHTYIVLRPGGINPVGFPIGEALGSSNYSVAMLWE